MREYIWECAKCGKEIVIRDGDRKDAKMKRKHEEKCGIEVKS